MNEPPSLPGTPPAKTQNGLSITSLVLGILSPVCLFFLTGIPAIVTGHIAFARAKRDPQRYGGANMALTGLILGYISLATTFMLIPAALLLPALSKAKSRAQTIACVNNMKQIGLAARLWSNDHNDFYPPDFLSMSNELFTPKILACPGDTTKKKVESWSQFSPAANLSYEFLTPSAKESEITSEVAFRCPIHGNIGLGDGSVQQVGKRR